MNELEQILTNTLAQASLTQDEQNTLSQYIPTLVLGLKAPVIDWECFVNQSHSEDLESTYQYYVSKGHNFKDCLSTLKLLVQLAHNHRNKSTIYKLVVCDDFCGAETYHCQTMEIAKDIVFGIFTDWDREEDTIDDIDQHIRENCVGSITVEEITLITKGE